MLMTGMRFSARKNNMPIDKEVKKIKFTNKWQKRFLDMAEGIGNWSKDRSTKVGCVIVDDNRVILATGYNGFPRGINDDVDERHDRPAKYQWTEHAERNAIYSAARNGIKLDGSTMFVPWLPCIDCMRGIVQSGIKTVVTKKLDDGDAKAVRWAESHKFSLALIEESDVELIWFK